MIMDPGGVAPTMQVVVMGLLLVITALWCRRSHARGAGHVMKP